MITHGLVFCIFFYISSMYYVKSLETTLFRDLNSLLPPCSTRDLVEVIPKNTDVLVYFFDKSADGSYVYGYILSNGERRYESGIQYYGVLYVEGFYSYRKFVNSKYVYETTRYRAGKDGYMPYRVETTDKPPKIPTLDNYATRDTEDRTEENMSRNFMEWIRPWTFI